MHPVKPEYSVDIVILTMRGLHEPPVTQFNYTPDLQPRTTF